MCDRIYAKGTGWINRLGRKEVTCFISKGSLYVTNLEGEKVREFVEYMKEVTKDGEEKLKDENPRISQIE